MSSQINARNMTDQAGSSPFALRHSIAVPRQNVFASWTEPAQLQGWMANGDLDVTILEFDLTAGGRFHFELRDGNGAKAWGLWIFACIETDRRLSFTEYQSDEHGAAGTPAKRGQLALATEVTFTGFHGVETFIQIASKPLIDDSPSHLEFEGIKPALQHAWSATLDRLELHCASRLALLAGRSPALSTR